MANPGVPASPRSREQTPLGLRGGRGRLLRAAAESQGQSRVCGSGHLQVRPDTRWGVRAPGIFQPCQRKWRRAAASGPRHRRHAFFLQQLVQASGFVVKPERVQKSQRVENLAPCARRQRVTQRRAGRLDKQCQVVWRLGVAGRRSYKCVAEKRRRHAGREVEMGRANDPPWRLLRHRAGFRRCLSAPQTGLPPAAGRLDSRRCAPASHRQEASPGGLTPLSRPARRPAGP